MIKRDGNVIVAGYIKIYKEYTYNPLHKLVKLKANIGTANIKYCFNHSVLGILPK